MEKLNSELISRERLCEFERGLDPARPEESKIPAKIVGYGEISAIFQIDNDSSRVYKRLPVFDTMESARKYDQMYREYCSLLETAGLSLPAHDTRIIEVPGRPVSLYISQEKLSGEDFGHCLIHRLGREESLDFIAQVVLEIEKVWAFNAAVRPEVKLAIDGQLSNWVRYLENHEKIYFIDTSTPLFCKKGVEQLDPELMLKSAPGFLRWMIRLFFLEDVMTRYYDRKLVFTDLAANLFKEQKEDLVDPAIERINRYLPDGDQLSREGVEKYYREDKLIWSLFLGLRRLDRFIITQLLRRRYEFILPGKIQR